MIGVEAWPNYFTGGALLVYSPIPGGAAAAIITKGLGILKFVTTTGPDIRCVKDIVLHDN